MSERVDRNMVANSAPQKLAMTLAAARRGDREAFSNLTEPHRLELLTHCYRMLGSIEDAEDQVQETFLRAWRRLDTYEGRASFRAWLYKIATNACLDTLKGRPKRLLPPEITAPIRPSDPLPPPREAALWIEPFPEDLLAPTSTNPEARFDAYEGISLAFLVALQVLPSRQRSALILKDVLDWPMAEIADALGSTQSSVASVLHRARETMKQRHITRKRESYRMSKPDDRTRELLERYMHAWEAADIDGIVSLLTEEATFPMPPFPLWVRGKASIHDFISRAILSGEAHDRFRLIPIRANGQPGYAFYQKDELTRAYHPFALQVLTIEGNRISDATTFGFPSLFRFFNLPPVLTT
ncbi:MAG: sigma-70 family RNA polymerase sigma factor [Acidobacteriaceae bacterium]